MSMTTLPTTPTREEGGEELSMRAYYYGFDATGTKLVDRILSAVACAGKAFHHTESWDDECGAWGPVFRGNTPAEWIQNAANDAAAENARLAERVRVLEGALKPFAEVEFPDPVPEGALVFMTLREYGACQLSPDDFHRARTALKEQR